MSSPSWRTATQPVLLALTAITGVAAYWFLEPFQKSVVMTGAEYAILGLSLNFIFGRAGRMSFGHSGFVGIAGYAGPLFVTRWDVSPLAAGLLALATVSIVAAIVTAPLLRLRGHYLALGTLAFGLVVLSLAQKLTWLTGGSNGLLVANAKILGVDVRESAYFLWLALLGIALWVGWRLHDTRFGRGLRAIRDDERAARASGIRVELFVGIAFVYSAVVAGAVGILHGYTFRVMAPEVIDLRLNVLLLVVVAIGGVGNDLGVAVAGFLLAVMPQILVGFEEREALYYGMALLLILILAPRGLGNELGDLVRRSSNRSPAIPEPLASGGPQRRAGE